MRRIQPQHLCYGGLFGTDCEVFLDNHVELTYVMKQVYPEHFGFRIVMHYLKENFLPGVDQYVDSSFIVQDYSSKDFSSLLLVLSTLMQFHLTIKKLCLTIMKLPLLFLILK